MATATAKTLPGQRLPEWVKNDPYWHSALYVLQKMIERDPKFLELTRKFIDLETASVSFRDMKKAVERWAHSEKIMVALAAHLFNEIHEFNLSDLDYLDSNNKQVAVTAIRVRFS